MADKFRRQCSDTSIKYLNVLLEVINFIQINIKTIPHSCIPFGVSQTLENYKNFKINASPNYK